MWNILRERRRRRSHSSALAGASCLSCVVTRFVTEIELVETLRGLSFNIDNAQV